MEYLLDHGIEIILWLQQASPALDAPFNALTSLGGGYSIFLIFALVYWCIDRSTGARLAVLFLASNWVNASLKDIFAQPRPFQYDPRVIKLSGAGGGGMPSSHTQATVVFWGYLACAFSRKWLWVIAGGLMILVPLSRMYLGVHFPTDLAGGYLVGAALLMVFVRAEDRAAQWFQEKSLTWQLAIAVIIPSFMAVISLGLSIYTVTAAITFMGLCVGLVLEQRFVRFDTKGTWAVRVARYLLGIIVIIALQNGLEMAFSGLVPRMALRGAVSFIAVLWGSFGAPWVFVRLGMSARRDR
ncbi:MAG: phosphatase PAP2 family protein [Deltaproteobacteria bacterium]|nr:phosphatase PAP2 family protein [Deltaproteobacteria bacterium]